MLRASRWSVVCAVMVLASLLAVPASARAQSPMDIYKRWLAAEAAYDKLVPDPKKLAEDAEREKVKEKAVPALKELSASLADLAKLQQLNITSAWRTVEVRSLLYLFGDEETVKAVDAGAESKEVEEKFQSEVVKLGIDFVLAADDAARKAAVDAFVKLATQRPDRHEIAGVAGFILTMNKDVPTEDRVLDVLHTKATGPATAEVATKHEAPRKLRNAIGKPLNFVFQTHDGKTIRAADFRGKVLMLHFFSSQNEASVRDVNRAARIYITQRSKGLELVSVSCDAFKGDLIVYLRDTPRITWPVLFDEFTADLGGGWHPLTKQLGVPKLPTTLLVDRKGVLRFANPENVDASVRELLAETP